MNKSDLKPEEELEALLADAATRVSVGSLYAHYKHPEHTYLVTALGIRRYTGEVCVIYEAQYGKKLTFVRTLEEWLLPGEQDGKPVARFTKL